MMLCPPLGMLVTFMKTSLVMQICTLLVQVLNNVKMSFVRGVLQRSSLVRRMMVINFGTILHEKLDHVQMSCRCSLTKGRLIVLRAR